MDSLFRSTWGSSPTSSHSRNGQYSTVKRGSANIQTIGVNWAYKFTKRRDELKTRLSRRYNHQRAKCEEPKIIKEWFDRVQITIMQHGIALEDIYNFDETGYAMGLIATAKVVSRAEMTGRPFLVQPGNREWVTSIECINSTGWALPPCIIFKGRSILRGGIKMRPCQRTGGLKSAIINGQLMRLDYDGFKIPFIPAINGRMFGKYRLLVLDGHGGHLTPRFDEICCQNDIIPICMPSHSSHLLQPLDMGCFSPLKRAYGHLVENKARRQFNHIDKFDFLEAYLQAHTEAFTTENIKNSFEASGLVTFKSRNSTWATQYTTQDLSPRTPHNLRQLEKQVSTIKKLLRQRTQCPPSPTKSALNQFVKGCEMAMNSAIILSKENQDLRAAHEK